MDSARRHSIWPCLISIAGHHITQHGNSLSTWDLRIDAKNGDAVTVDDITLDEAQAFIKCLHRMLIHTAPEDQPEGLRLPDIDPAILQDLAQDAGISLAQQPPPADEPPADEPPTDPSGTPRTDPPSTGPESGAAQEPFAAGGWIPPGAAMHTVRAGEYVLPLPPGGVCVGGEWIVPSGGPWPSLPGRQANFEVRFDQAAPLRMTHAMPRVVHVKPGEVINLTCSCQTIAGGTLSDDPNCQMHHGVPTVYVFDGR